MKVLEHQEFLSDIREFGLEVHNQFSLSRLSTLFADLGFDVSCLSGRRIAKNIMVSVLAHPLDITVAELKNRFHGVRLVLSKLAKQEGFLVTNVERAELRIVFGRKKICHINTTARSDTRS